MRKLALLTLFMAALVPLKAHAFNSALNPADDTLAYVAMPLAVSNVCNVRGVQTDQVASLAAYMDQAQVSPEGFIDVFRYAPVALVYSSGRRPDFVQWVGTQVGDGVTGDQLVSAMETQLQTYGGDVVSVPRTYRRHYEPRYYEPDYYDVAFEPDYVPIGVRRYCERELLDPFAMIDMPVAVADVCDLGVPYDRVGRLVVQLDLGNVEPWQTVELLRYAPPALLVSDYGQPDFAQYVYDQRVGGLNGYPLVQVASQQLLTYNVVAQIDPVPQVYTGRTAFAPVAQNYVSPIDSTNFVPPVVRTRVASGGGASGRGFQQPMVAPAGAPVAVPSPQVTRLLGERGTNSVVVNPGQARRELAQTNRAEREATRGAYVPQTGFPVAQTPQNFREHGGRMVHVGGPAVAPVEPNFTAARGGEGRHGQGASPQFRTFNPPAVIQQAPPPQAAIESRHGGGSGREHVAAPRTFAAPPPQMMAPREGRHIEAAPQAFAPPRVEQRREVAQPRAVAQPQFVPQPRVFAPTPPPPQQHGHGGGPPQATVATPPPQPVVAQANGHGQAGQAGPPPGNPQGEKKKGKDH